MTIQTKALLDAALALPEVERALLADRLYESLLPDYDALTDEQLYAELERRDAELEKDPSLAYPMVGTGKGRMSAHAKGGFPSFGCCRIPSGFRLVS